MAVFCAIVFSVSNLYSPAFAASPLQSASATSSEIQITVARPAANLRGGPGTNYAIVGTAKRNDIFLVVGRNSAGSWYKIKLSDGKEAWIAASLVQVSGDATKIAVVDNPAPAAQPTVAAATNVTMTTATAPAPASPPTASAPAARTSSVRAGQLSGRLLYSVANMDAKRWELWEYNFATASSTKVADWRTEVDVSGDGKQIAYFAWPNDAGEKAGIWIMDADFTKNRLVVTGGAYPSFSPGGDRLVANGGDILFVFKTDGSGIRGLTKGEYPAWNPVNNQIVHRACEGGNCGLWIIDADSMDAGARTHITRGGSDGQPAWHPNGKRIAYISQEDGNFEIYAIDSDGGNKVRLTTSPSSDGLPVWSPDGQWIAFRSDRDGKWGIYVMRADGSDARKVVDADVLPLWFFEKMGWRE